MKGKKQSLLSRLVSVIPFLLVLMFSFGLLLYTGIGDANRVYRKQYLAKVASFGEIVKNPVNTYLLLGFPLEHYAGFEGSSKTIFEAEPVIQHLQIRDESGEVVFSVSKSGKSEGRNAESSDKADLPKIESSGAEDLKKIDNILFAESRIALQSLSAADTGLPVVSESEDTYRIRFALNGRSGTVGSLDVLADKVGVDDKIFWIFLPVGGAALGLILLFGLLVVFLFRKTGKGSKIGIQILFAASFLVLAGFIIFSLVNLYTEGVQDKTNALARSLAARLDSALTLNLDLDDFTEIDKLFAQYTMIDPDIDYISLKENTETKISVKSTAVPAVEIPLTSEVIDIDIPLFGPEGKEQLSMKITVGVPLNRVYEQLFRSGKNFIVLFISCIFLSILFLNILFAVRKKNEVEEGAVGLEASQDLRLELIRPLYFLAVFMEGLFMSFLPQFFQGIAAQSAFGIEASSWLFTIYFAAFVFSLLPTGRLAERSSIKWLLITGIIFCVAGYSLLAFAKDFYVIVASRVLAGLGQGILFISIQSYILRTATAGRKTQGSGIIVFGYNGGIISGMALGALLVTMLGDEGVFLLAAGIAVFVFLYILFFVQKLPKLEERRNIQRRTGMFRSFFKALGDLEFVRTIFLVGLITKAVLTGVNSFALPLLLNSKGYIKEDIGQILIFYSGAVLFSSRIISPIIDKYGKSRGILFFGTQVGGLALYGMGFAGHEIFAGNSFLQTLLFIGGMVVLGLGHGCIHAPVVTHIANTKVARSSGVSSVTSLYRFLERIGHVAGPLIIGPLVYGLAMNPFFLSWVGAAAMIGGVLFFIGKGRTVPVFPHESEGGNK